MRLSAGVFLYCESLWNRVSSNKPLPLLVIIIIMKVKKGNRIYKAPCSCEWHPVWGQINSCDYSEKHFVDVKPGAWKPS